MTYSSFESFSKCLVYNKPVAKLIYILNGFWLDPELFNCFLFHWYRGRQQVARVPTPNLETSMFFELMPPRLRTTMPALTYPWHPASSAAWNVHTHDWVHKIASDSWSYHLKRLMRRDAVTYLSLPRRHAKFGADGIQFIFFCLIWFFTSHQQYFSQTWVELVQS